MRVKQEKRTHNQDTEANNQGVRSIKECQKPVVVNAYIVVNPMGRLLDNTGHRYRETEPLLDHSFDEVFPQIRFLEACKRRH